MRPSVSGISKILFVVSIVVATACSAEEEGVGSLVPKPGPLAFAFIIGEWEADVRLPQPDGSMARQTATWSARYVLDGRAIVEEYEAKDPDGNIVVLGINLRRYDEEEQRWIMNWFDALSGDVLPLGPTDLGGVTINADGISFRFLYADVLSRARFDGITKDSFTWHGDVSTDDGANWQIDTIIVEARRAADGE